MDKGKMGAWDIPHLRKELEGQVLIQEGETHWTVMFQDDPSSREVAREPIEALAKLAMRGLGGSRVERV